MPETKQVPEVRAGGTILSKDGAIIQAVQDGIRPSGAVVIDAHGFQLTTTVPRTPPTPEEEPPEEGEKQDSGAEATLWRALSLGERRGRPVQVRPNRKNRRRGVPAPPLDDGGAMLV